MDEVRAAIMQAQLKRLTDILARLRSAKNALREQLSQIEELQFRTIHDPMGDSATTLVLFLPSVESARGFVGALERRGIRAGTEFAAAQGRPGEPPHTMYEPTRADRHIYKFWTYIMSQGLARKPGCSYECPRYSGRRAFDSNACPETLELLSRGVSLGISPDWSSDDVKRFADKVRKAVWDVTRR